MLCHRLEHLKNLSYNVQPGFTVVYTATNVYFEGSSIHMRELPRMHSHTFMLFIARHKDTKL